MRTCEYCGMATNQQIDTSFGTIACCDSPSCIAKASLESDKIVDRAECKRSFELLKQAGKGFKAMYDQLMYNTENNMCSYKFADLEALLDEFISECEFAERRVNDWFR